VRAAEPDLRAAAFGDAKLVQPRIREGTAQRPDLAYRLRPTARSTVALIVAPAGYGKTTILAELAGPADSRPFVWIMADSADNDPLSFARCITNGLEQSDAIPAGTLRAKAKSGDSHAVLVARLVQALKAAHPLAIAIDDLQFVRSTRSLKIVEAVANNLPPRSQLLLASRTRPRLGLTALRAAGRLIEIGTDDLRLSADEARRLLRASGVDVSPADGADLIARAEGWPAGLYLAALAYASDGKALDSFGGSDRFVGDYFDAEYLDELDAEDLDFLIEASVLDSLSAPVCDAVLRTSGSAARLERIARRNLFVTGLGSAKPRVYRMHPMLREALSAKLQRRDPSRIAAIANRAADWSERLGNVEETVEYAWTAGNRERFAALAEQAALPLLQIGQLATIERWLARLDTDLLDRYPALAICGAYVHHIRGRPDEADAWAATATRVPVETVMPDGTPSPEPWTAALRAGMCRNGKDEMRQDAARALSGLAEGSPWRPTALMLLGVGQLLAEETVAADELLAEAHLAATRAECTSTAAVAFATRSLLSAAEGRWDVAGGFAASARQVLQDARLENDPTSPITFVAAARCAVHCNDWVGARNDLARARACLPDRAPAWFLVQVCLESVRVHLGLSQRNEAAVALARVETVLDSAPDLGVLLTQAAELRAKLDRTVGGPADQLTPAERRLLPLLTTHLTFKEIGELLRISRNTVKTQAISTYRKLDVTSRSSAIDRAIELGLVEMPDALGVTGRDRDFMHIG
jgi:LuxR family transcriptional regulator, maltose regulon positive regulatory protein